MNRGGPGLGDIGPSQGDYFQSTRGGGHGDYRLLVLAPSSAQEAYDMARRQGKSRLVALRAECGPVPDARWPKFMRLVGFTSHRQYQAAELELGHDQG